MTRKRLFALLPLIATLAGCAAREEPPIIPAGPDALYVPERVVPGRLEYAPDRSTFAPILTERFAYPTQPEANAAYLRLIAAAQPGPAYPASVWLFGCKPGALDAQTARIARYHGPVVHCATDFLDRGGRRLRRETANFYYDNHIWSMQPVYPPRTSVAWRNRESSPKDFWWWLPGRPRYEQAGPFMARPISSLIQYIRCCILFSATISGSFAFMEASHAQAQTVTADPGAWRSMSYANLQVPSPATATYIDIWKDAIDENNRHYEQRGDRRFAGANAPANEAHFVIWSSRRSVVFSVLDTASQCEAKTAFPAVGATVKLCPMRIAIYEGLQVRTMDGGKACFLELDKPSPTDATASGSYASYDVARRALKTGLIVNHVAVDGCSFDVPIPR